MELLERSSRLNEGLLRRYSRRAGPALGGLLGIVPQCGISGAAATLFSTGSITVGTMLAVFFATSDEMLPIFLSSLTESSGISWKAIVLITLSKAALGILLGYLADLLFGRWFRAQKSIHSFCEREHCDCDEEEGSVFLAALRHTLKIAAMLIAVNFALNLLFHYIGVERLSGTVLNRPVLGELILALFGLIPNWLRFRRRDRVLPERRARALAACSPVCCPMPGSACSCCCARTGTGRKTPPSLPFSMVSVCWRASPSRCWPAE